MRIRGLCCASAAAIALGACNGDPAIAPVDQGAPLDFTAAPDLTLPAPPDLTVLDMGPDWPVGGAVGFTTVGLGDGAASKSVSSCLVFTDLDGDDRPDLFFTPSNDGYSMGGVAYFLRNVDGKSFEEHAIQLDSIPMAWQCLAADLDNDGLPEIYVLTGLQSTILLHNDGGGKFHDVTGDAGLADPANVARSAGFLDYDADGRLDLYLPVLAMQALVDQRQTTCDISDRSVYCQYMPTGAINPDARIYRNVDGKTFKPQMGLGATNGPNPGLPNVVGVADWDFDGYPDLMVCNDFATNRAFRNDQGTGFSEVTSALKLPAHNNGMGVAFADFDADGQLDFYFAELGNSQLWFAQPAGSPQPYVERGNEVGVGKPTHLQSAWAPSAADFNNDGWIDVFLPSSGVIDKDEQFKPFMLVTNLPVTATQADTLFVNLGPGNGFEPHTMEHPHSHPPAFALAASATADYDGDGRIDLAEVYGLWPQTYLRLFHNDTADAGHSLRVKLVGKTANRQGIGATLLLTVHGQTQIRQVQATPGSLGTPSPIAHFGMGRYTSAEKLVVIWPGGQRQEQAGPIQADRLLTVSQQ
jgi:hypothetical protein